LHIRGDISGDRRNVGRIATSPHESPQGYGFKLISALLFAGMSALVRQLGDVAPVGQMVFFRSAFAIVPVVVIYAFRGELASAVRTSRPLGQLGRGTLSVCGMFTNFSALTRLPLADATAISFASPLTVALAALVLKERVRIYRWSAVIAGFVGVIVMLIPHFDLSQLALHQSLLSDLRSRSLPRFAMPERSSKLGDLRKMKPRHRSSSTSRSSARLSGSLTLPFAWHSPTLSELTALIALGFLGGLAHIFLTESYRYAAASVVAPFD
jgi:drug/metabolite transporter (DMT)-like permease